MIEPTFQYDLAKATLIVKWPWFHSQPFDLSSDIQVRRLAAALDQFYFTATLKQIEPKDYVSIKALRALVELAQHKLQRLDESGRPYKPSFEELFP